MIKIFDQVCEFWGFQEERCPSTGKLHLQGAFKLKEKGRPMELFGKVMNTDDGKPHWKKVTYKKQSYEWFNYVGKVETSVDGENRRWKGGKLPKPKKPIMVPEIYGWQLDAEKLAIDECKTPINRKLNWFYDLQGNMGKSSFCKYMAIKHGCIVVQGGKMADIVNIIFNTDMDEVPCLIFDIPRSKGASVSYAAIECVLNGMITNTKFETGTKCFNPPQVIVLSNFPPTISDETLSADRWNITNLTPESYYTGVDIKCELDE